MRITNVTCGIPLILSPENLLNGNPRMFLSRSMHPFETVARHIHAGNSYLVNLTCATPVHANLSLKDIFYQSKAMYKLLDAGSFRGILAGDIQCGPDGLIYSYPMKGTIDATLPDARRRILDDPKGSGGACHDRGFDPE